MTMTSSFVLTKRSPFEVAINGRNTSFPKDAVSSFI